MEQDKDKGRYFGEHNPVKNQSQVLPWEEGIPESHKA